MYAIISDRNNQATVGGRRILCDLMDDAERGSTITFDHVLMVGGEEGSVIGKPVEGASVTGEVMGLERGDKVVVFRFKRRKNIRVKRGHRQSYTRVESPGSTASPRGPLRQTHTRSHGTQEGTGLDP